MQLTTDVVQTGLEMLWDVLQPNTAIRALVVAHIAGEQSVRAVCLEFVRECCNQIDRKDWMLLRAHGDLMIEVMDVIALREKVVSPSDEIKTQLLHSIMARLEAAEARAEQETLRRIAVEDKLAALLREGSVGVECPYAQTQYPLIHGHEELDQTASELSPNADTIHPYKALAIDFSVSKGAKSPVYFAISAGKAASFDAADMLENKEDLLCSKSKSEFQLLRKSSCDTLG